MSLVLN